MSRSRLPAAAVVPAIIPAITLAVVLLATAGAVRADDYVAVRGVYYREASTRVVQPMVELERDSPTGVDVGAHFLIDAITSASAAAGTAIDNVFTETRSEAGLSLRKRWARSEISVGYKYSAESDYWSHSVGLGGSKTFWGNTAMLRLALGRNFDTMTSRGRTPDCAIGVGNVNCPLDVWFAGLSYTQVLSPVSIAQLSFDSAYLDGFQGNLYRQVPGKGYEVLPYGVDTVDGKTVMTDKGQRLRMAVTARAGYVVRDTGTGFQLNYRYYWDTFPGTAATTYAPWGVRAHTLEARVFQPLGPELELRVLGRIYIQNRGAAFWCDTIANPNCYAPGAAYYSSDPKLGPMNTEYLEAKVYWHAEAWRAIRFLRWFSAGTFEFSYGRYTQSTSFGGPAQDRPWWCLITCVIQAGYTMPY